MRRLLVGIGAVSLAVLVLGCPKKKEVEAEGGLDAATVDSGTPTVEDAAAAVVPVTITAKNVADIARYPGETALVDDDAKLAQITVVHTAPKTGGVVATLRPGLDPQKIAEYGGSVLVQFPSPTDATATLLGWVVKEAFTAPTWVFHDAGIKIDASVPVVDAGPPKTLCAPGSVAVVLSTKDTLCRKKCAKDGDCKGGAAGGCANANAVSGGIVRVCNTE